MARWASWMILVAFLGCTADAFAQAPRVQRAPPVVPEVPQDEWRERPPRDARDMRGASRRFARAYENFAVAVRRLSTTSAPPSDRDIAFTLELFARAIESAPHGHSVRAPRAAADMRAALDDANLVGPPGSPPARQALADALYIGTDVLLELAYGPYRHSREVTSQAWELEDALYGSEYDSPVRDDQRFAVVLRQSVFLMREMLEVGSAPPPPPPRRYRSR